MILHAYGSIGIHPVVKTSNQELRIVHILHMVSMSHTLRLPSGGAHKYIFGRHDCRENSLIFCLTEIVHLVLSVAGRISVQGVLQLGKYRRETCVVSVSVGGEVWFSGVSAIFNSIGIYDARND